MKKVAVIQDLSSFGKCSLTAAIPVLSVMGVQAVPLPTAILSAQTGYPSFFYEDLTSKMEHFIHEWDKLNIAFDGIYTGFVTGQEQIENIFHFLNRFHTSETLLLVDPVMGDIGEVYKLFTNDMLDRMKELVKCANVITPNLTECCLLTGVSYEKLSSYSDEKDFMQAVEETGKTLQGQTNSQVIITGITPPSSAFQKQSIGNMYLDGENTYYHEMEYNGLSYSGTGDLFASVLMGSMLRGEDIEKSLQLAQQFLSAAIRNTYEEQIPEIEGVYFEKFLNLLM